MGKFGLLLQTHERATPWLRKMKSFLLKILFSYLVLKRHIYKKKKKGVQTVLPSVGSLTKWLQWPEPSSSNSGDMRFLWVSHICGGAQVTEPLFAAFPGHKQRAEWKAKQPKNQPVSIWRCLHLQVEPIHQLSWHIYAMKISTHCHRFFPAPPASPDYFFW